MAETKRRRKRIEIIDIAKCITIFMVVLGHTATNDELLGGNPPILVKVLYAIHMPLFFFLSGLSISTKPLKNWSEWKSFLRKTVMTIGIPYLVWALIYCTFNFDNLGWIMYGSWRALGKTATVTSLWYLSCLLIARIVVQIVICMVPHKKGSDDPHIAYVFVAAILMIIGVALPEIEIGYPWCADVALVAAGCILLGIYFKKGLLKIAVQKGWVLFALLIASVGAFAGVTILVGDDFGVMMMCRGGYGNPLYALIFALLGGFAVLILAMIVKRMADEWLPIFSVTHMLYMGQHTMGIFLIHKPMLQNIWLPAFQKIFTGGADIVARLLATIVSILISLFLSQIVEYYIPELIGIFSKDKLTGRRTEAN